MSSDLPDTAGIQSWSSDRPTPLKRFAHSQLVAAILVCGTIAAFLLDVLTPRGFADAVGYPVLLTLCLWLRGRYVILMYAALATVLTIAGGFLSAGGGISIEGTAINRAFGLAALWATAVILMQRARLETRLRRSERAALAASQAKSSFLANMSHELRTPLNVIIGFADLIARQSAGPIAQAKYVDYASTIQKSGEHLLSMVNDVLDLSKIEADKYRIEEAEVGLSDAAIEAIRLVAKVAEDAGLTIDNQVDGALPRILGDRRAIRQILLNLLSNAIKFTPAGGRITVAAGLSDEGAWLSVSDTGIGIARQDLDRLGVPFLRVGQVKSETGAGLGLALCRRLAEFHGGRIEIESERGRGTTVRLVVPKSRVASR